MDVGFRRIITTPHIMADLYPNTPDVLREGLVKLQQAMKAEKINIDISVAAEYFMDDHFAAILEHAEILSFGDRRVLVEMSMMSAPPNLYRDLFQLQIKGYRPILAHPERYIFLKDDFRQYERLRDHGCEFQLNLLSVTGYYGKPVRDNALKLLKNNMIDYLATDMHHEQHAGALKALAADKALMKILQQQPYQNMQLSEPN
jgi:tyrosine-protein phosphatase YwqE